MALHLEALAAQVLRALAGADLKSRQSRKSLQMNMQNPIHHTNTSPEAIAANARAEPAFVAPTFFQHITFNTGHSCRQPREAVAPTVVATLAKVIADGIANGGWTDLKRFGEDSPLQVSVSGSTLLAKLYLPCKDPQAARPAIQIGISARASAGADTWKHLLSTAARIGAGVTVNPPAKPWIGAVFDDQPMLAAHDIKQFMAYAAMMQWAGDFERCLAWGFVTWLESTSRRE